MGCGNGWFSHHLSLIPNTEVHAVDLNISELQQAARIFKKEGLHFIYADIFSKEADILHSFDVITVNSCIQYFSDIQAVIEVLTSKLTDSGELHILDSPFYKETEKAGAKERTSRYYKKVGVPEMAAHYFHHSLTDLERYDVLYQPKQTVLNRMLRKRINPFSWIRITKENEV